MSGPVPGREGPHSIGVPIRYPLFFYNTYLYVAENVMLTRNGLLHDAEVMTLHQTLAEPLRDDSHSIVLI